MQVDKALAFIIYPEIRMRATKAKQRNLFRGGPRPNSGRPRGNRVSHDRRPRFSRRAPVHVTLRARRHVWNLRSSRSWRRIRRAFEKARGRFGVRLIEYSIQGNHLHLIVEADSSEALARAMQGLAIRLAKALNAMMGLHGAVFDDHYFGHILENPTELARAIRYVLGNHEHHFGTPSAEYTSAELSRGEREQVLSAPLGWLLTAGIQRAPGPPVYPPPKR